MTPDATPAPTGAPEALPAAEPEAVPPHADASAPSEPRVTDALPEVLAAPGSGAELVQENPELRATLSRIFRDPQYRPAAGPAGDPGELTDAEVDKLWQDYQDVPDGEEKQAYKRMLLQATDLALKRVQGLSTKQRIEETNTQRAVQQATALKSAISAQVQQLAPDVDLDLFWQWGARIAQQEALAHRFPDVPAALDWQVRRAIQLVRGKLGPSAAGAPAARGTRGRSPSAPRPRTMVDQLNAIQREQRGGY